jgi:hypothetical protein
VELRLAQQSGQVRIRPGPLSPDTGRYNIIIGAG